MFPTKEVDSMFSVARLLGGVCAAPLLCFGFASLAAPGSGELPQGSFEMAGIKIGQPLEEARSTIFSLECVHSCAAEGLELHGHPGNFWAGLADGKIDQLAFGFRPKLSLIERAAVRSEYVQKYGPPSDNLGFEGCDEWRADGGYLAICLRDDLSHIWWSRNSRVDVNQRRP